MVRIMQSLRSFGEQVSRRVVLIPLVVAITALCLSAAALMINTYVIYDGAQMQVHRSYESSPESLLASVGKPLGELDAYDMVENEGRYEITLHRAGQITLKADGKETPVAVRYDDTVEQAIARAGITLGELDEVNPAKNEPATYGSTISVARIAVTQSVKTVDIPFEKVIKNNSSMESGKSKVTQAGVNGEKQQTYEVKTRDGVVVSETLLKEVVVKQPQSEITEKGTKVSANVVGGAGTLSTSRGVPQRYSKVIDVVATAYSSELISNKLTATGAVARVGLIAVDPRVIPLGTRMYITSADGKSWVYGYAVAADTGGAIKGNKIDLFFNTERECYKFGRRRAKVYILD